MKVTVQDVVERLQLPVGHREGTVDGLLSGDGSSEVTGIVTCFMPTISVIERAIEWGANLVVAHEGPYYAHRRESEVPNAVAERKNERIDASGVAVYRCHDYPHRIVPDLITEALVDSIGWSSYVREAKPAAAIVEPPPAAVGDVARMIKEKLGVASLRVIGDLEAECGRVGVFAGHRGGGATVVPLFEQDRLDLAIYGEGPEWETPEYVRDALRLGEKKAVLVLGHGESEEPGMAALADRLRTQFPALPVRHAKERPLFAWI